VCVCVCVCVCECARARARTEGTTLHAVSELSQQEGC
jgi:hypothetical protein